jgi:hypothetical protein
LGTLRPSTLLRTGFAQPTYYTLPGKQMPSFAGVDVLLDKMKLKNNAELTYYAMHNGLKEQ